MVCPFVLFRSVAISWKSLAEWRLPRPGRGLPRAVFDLTVSGTQYAKLSGEPKVPNASLLHSRRQEVRRRQRMRSKLWTRRSGHGPPRESERCSPAATTKMHPTDWIGSKHS